MKPGLFVYGYVLTVEEHDHRVETNLQEEQQEGEHRH